MRVSCAVILENGRILVTKRPEHKHLGSLWEFPGGKLRQGENPKQGLKREIREELGIRISINRLIERVNYSYDPSNLPNSKGTTTAPRGTTAYVGSPGGAEDPGISARRQGIN